MTEKKKTRKKSTRKKKTTSKKQEKVEVKEQKPKALKNYREKKRILKGRPVTLSELEKRVSDLENLVEKLIAQLGAQVGSL